MDDEQKQHIIIDLGSGYIKCGFGEQDSPSSIFKNIIGRPRADTIGIISNDGNDASRLYVGEDASNNSAALDIDYPVKGGIIVDDEGFKAILTHAIETELRQRPEDHNLLLTEAPSNPKENREKMFRICFEELGVPGVQCQIQAVLALYASGRTTGMVLDSGDGVTHTVPVFEGYARRESVSDAKNAGSNVTKEVAKCLKLYHAIDLSNEGNCQDICRRVKEKVCRIALNYDEEMEELKQDKSKKITYEFSDGSTVDVAELQIEPAEILYNPRTKGYPGPGITDLIKHSIDSSNVDMRTQLFQATILSGGTTCLPGFQERCLKEYKSIVPNNSKDKVQIYSDKSRKYSVFCGGSILVSLSTFQSRWIMKSEFDDSGDVAKLIAEKCDFL